MVRLRIRYEKRGAIRFTSHRDLMRIFRRCFAAGEIPIRFSQGFNPHPRFSFGPSLRTGWESLDEYMDVILETSIDDLAARCNAHLPDGLRVLDTAPMVESVPKLSADVKAVRYELVLDAEVKSDVEESFINRVPDPEVVGGDRRKRALADEWQSALRRRFNVEGTDNGPTAARTAAIPVVEHIAVRDVSEPASDNPEREDTGIHIEYLSTMHGGRNVSPEELVTPVFGDPARFSIPMRVTRAALYVRRRGQYVSPISSAVVEKLI